MATPGAAGLTRDPYFLSLSLFLSVPKICPLYRLTSLHREHLGRGWDPTMSAIIGGEMEGL